MSNVHHAPFYSVKGMIELKMLPWKDERTATKHLQDWGLLRVKGGLKYVLTSELMDFLSNDEIYSSYVPKSNQLKKVADEIE